MHAGCSSALLVLHWLWHTAQPPLHLSAIVVQKFGSGLAVRLELGVQIASVLVRVDPAETVCCGIAKELELVSFRQGCHASTMLR